MRRALFVAGNAIAGVILVLLIRDPNRSLMPIYVLMALAILRAWVLPRFIERKK